ncbi:MAG: outer membrane protein insertion porin family, partial [Verrucomicrobiota bacterium]
GLDTVPEKKARAYFIETGGLFSLKQNRVYSPDKFDRSLRNLRDELHRTGFQEATVSAAHLERDDRTGVVKTSIQVNQGPRFFVHSVRLEVSFENTNAPVSVSTNWPGDPYSQWWEQDYALSIKTNFYRLGYPDTSVEVQTLARDPQTNEVRLDLRAIVQTGPFVRVGNIGFTGNKHTKTNVLERRIPLHEGELLNRIKAERGRYRLSRLGVFDSVELSYENVDEHTRNLLYHLEEAKRIEVSLLFGYGSYELLRGGVQLDQYDVFGLAHRQQLKLTQSFKSSSADYLYTLPEFFGEDVDLFINASGLRRQEISFLRLEYGGGAGLRKFFRNVNTDMSVRYNYQILEADGGPTNLFRRSAQNSGVGAIITDLNHDRRDNPLYPHHGYRVYGNVELASEYLASDVNYQRLDLSLSYHAPVSDSQWIHFGLSHGLVATLGSRNADLPFNRRFFPGGENSVRGYQQGEAAPRDAEGKIVGAETYLQGNVEFEQGLTPKFSLVVFVDGVGFARELKNYPFDQALFSAGGGIQWKTIIGPVRLEYGYNLNPRPRDPVGTLHFSLGFPF